MKKIFLILMLIFSCVSLYAQTSKEINKVYKVDSKEAIELFINKKGKFFVNNKKVKSEDLSAIISKVRKRKGIIKFAQEYDSSDKFKKSYLLFMNLISKHKTAMEPYTDKTFTKLMLQ